MKKMEKVKLGCNEIKIVKEFCCLSDMIGKDDSTGRVMISRIGSGWRKFIKLLDLLCAKMLSHRQKRRLYKAYVRSVICYSF